jgi:hypothetical protein
LVWLRIICLRGVILTPNNATCFSLLALDTTLQAQFISRRKEFPSLFFTDFWFVVSFKCRKPEMSSVKVEAPETSYDGYREIYHPPQDIDCHRHKNTSLDKMDDKESSAKRMNGLGSEVMKYGIQVVKGKDEGSRGVPTSAASATPVPSASATAATQLSDATSTNSTDSNIVSRSKQEPAGTTPAQARGNNKRNLPSVSSDEGVARENGGKRSRRPPPRFGETAGLDRREESILRQAIENSKIETHLCDTVEIGEVPIFR